MSIFRKLLGNQQDGGAGKGGNTPPGLQTMGAQLQRKFAKGVQYNSKLQLWHSQNIEKKLRTLKGDYWTKQWFSSIASLFKIGTSLQGKNSLPEGVNSFL